MFSALYFLRCELSSITHHLEVRMCNSYFEKLEKLANCKSKRTTFETARKTVRLLWQCAFTLTRAPGRRACMVHPLGHSGGKRQSLPAGPSAKAAMPVLPKGACPVHCPRRTHADPHTFFRGSGAKCRDAPMAADALNVSYSRRPGPFRAPSAA